MPTTHAEDRIIPKSVLRHRPISTGHYPEAIPTNTIPRASRMKSSIRPSRSVNRARPTAKQVQLRLHWMVIVGLTMMGMIVFLLLFQLVAQWWTITSNDVR